MADTKISALTDGVTANATDQIPVARAGANVFISPAYIRTYILNQDLTQAVAGILSWTGRTKITAPADGQILVTDTAGTSFARLMLGGTTASFPSIKRNGATIDFRLASDTGYCTITAGSVQANASVLATTGVGYLTANTAGGTVTQATSKSTGVTLNKATGEIVMNGAALAAATTVGFTLTNSSIAAVDVVMVSIKSGASADSYHAQVSATAAGSCRIELRNTTAGSLSEAVVLSFAVVKGSVN